MSFTYDSDTKERVRAATDLVDLIGSRLELRRQGRNYACLCPWHKDSRPSLQVNPERQIWKCWVCDIGGDAFNFMMKYDGITFPEALKSLADRAGIQITPTAPTALRNRSSSGKSPTDAKADLYRALSFAEKFFHDYLLHSPEAAVARNYLTERAIQPASIQLFGIGLAPNNWSALLDEAAKQRISPQLLEAAGLVIKRDRGGYYDRFRNRVMFPIRDRENRTIAFGGRVLPGSDEGAKYINSPETRLFQKSQQLYAFDVANLPMRRSRQAVVMEGYTDVIIAHQCGIDNAVAVLGTALGAAHLKLLRHFVDSVVLLLDGDEAGQRRSDDVLELFLHAQMDVRVMTLPDGLDPADYLNRFGGDALREMMSSAADALEFKLRRISAGFDPLVDTHRANSAVEEMLSLLAKVPTSGLISNDAFRMRQNQVLPRLARQFSIPEDMLRERLTSLRTKNSRSASLQRVNTEEASTQTANNQNLLRPGDLSPFERELLELIIVAPQIAPMAMERVQPGWLECEAAKAMFDAYQQLDFAGHSLEFDSVLVALEDPDLKSLLVTMFEQAHAKLKFTRESAEDRLRVLTHRMGERREAVQRQQLVAKLQKGVSADEELSVLQDIIMQARQRQGLKQPTAPETITAISTATDDPRMNNPIAHDEDGSVQSFDSENNLSNSGEDDDSSDEIPVSGNEWQG